MKTNETGKEALPNAETVTNPGIYDTLQFDRDVEDWNFITQGINLMMAYSLISMSADGILTDPHNQNCIQSALFFKNEIEQAVTYSLTNIKGTNQLFKETVVGLDFEALKVDR